MKTKKITKEFIEIGNCKNVISFDPPIVGRLFRNIFNGKYVVVEHNRVVPISFEQAEIIIKNNF